MGARYYIMWFKFSRKYIKERTNFNSNQLRMCFNFMFLVNYEYSFVFVSFTTGRTSCRWRYQYCWGSSKGGQGWCHNCRSPCSWEQSCWLSLLGSHLMRWLSRSKQCCRQSLHLKRGWMRRAGLGEVPLEGQLSDPWIIHSWSKLTPSKLELAQWWIGELYLHPHRYQKRFSLVSARWEFRNPLAHLLAGCFLKELHP